MATKEKREEWKRAGLCSCCGKNKPVEGGITCQECRDRQKANRDYKREHNICVKCGRNKAAPNRKYCDECLEWRSNRYKWQKENNPEFSNIRKQYYERHREKCIKNGLCVNCSKPAYKNHVLCYECLIKAKNWTKRARASAKEFKGE